MKHGCLRDDPFLAVRDSLDATLLAAAKRLNAKRIDIHGARKQLKRARALVRLLRDAVGDEVYREWNTRLRDGARPLSAARDAEVLLLTLRGLIADDQATSRQLSGLRRTLRMEQQRHQGTAMKRKPALARRIEAMRRDVARVRAHEPGWSAVISSLRRTYKHGRRERDAALQSATAERLHEWRKQVKYLWHQHEALQPRAPKALKKSTRQLHALADLLGDDHDLYVLRARIARTRSLVDEDIGMRLEQLIDRKRLKLQKRAFKAGAPLFEETPQHLERRFTKYSG